MRDNTKRFSDRVDNYTKYRPSYPEDAIAWILSKCESPRDKVFADIGSGTGIFSKLLIPNAKVIYGVEPNFEMRSAAEKDLNKYSNFVSINGTAEKTNLDNESIDHITVAQAFHWFDQEKSFLEIKRILKKNGSIFLIWNLRRTNTEFMNSYESLLLKSSGDYRKASADNKVDFEGLARLMPRDFEVRSFYFEKAYEWADFVGRHNTSAYSPKELSGDNVRILDNLKGIFDKHANRGMLSFFYETKIYFGKLA